MQYVVLTFQQYRQTDAAAFLELETQFRELEARTPGLPRGDRYRLRTGTEATETLLWKFEVSSVREAEDTLRKLAEDPTHALLLEKQLPLIANARTEIYELHDLQPHE
jgi:hypothetical protein